MIVLGALLVALVAPGDGDTHAATVLTRLAPEDLDVAHRAGFSVAIDGDTLVVGTPDSTLQTSGAAYVYERNGAQWQLSAKLTAPDGVAGTRFGDGVAINGDVIVVGAKYDSERADRAGSAWVFRRQGDDWVSEAKLTASDADADDEFARYVAVSGDVIAASSYSNSDFGHWSGSAYIYERSESGGWTEVAKLLPSDPQPEQYFGYGIAASGDSVLIGAYRDSREVGPWSGAGYVFTRRDGVWSEEAKLAASDPWQDEQVGFSVDLDGDTAVLGSIRDLRGIDDGSAYVFRRSGDTWQEEARLRPSDGATGDRFGYSVAVRDDVIVVGAERVDSQGGDAGAAYIFRRSGGGWDVGEKIVAPDLSAGDLFGHSVATSGGTVVIGAPDHDGVAHNGGAAWVAEALETPADSATLTVTKVVVNDDGGTARPGDFTLLIDGQPATSGQPRVLEPGQHTVAESGGPDGYHGSVGGECAPDGSIVLIAGQDASCTITNDDVEGASGAGTPTAFLETVDGDPSAPTPWAPAGWDIAVHSQDPSTWERLEPMQAQHQPDCGDPFHDGSGTHFNDSYTGAVYQCKNHVMTAISAAAHGAIYLTPSHLLDLSGGEGRIRFDVSTLDRSDGDWIEVWISPFEEQLQLPVHIDSGLERAPRDAIHVRQTPDGSFTVSVYRDFARTDLGGSVNSWGGVLLADLNDPRGGPSAKNRQTIEIVLTPGNLRVWMPDFDYDLVDTAIPPLNFDSAVVQFTHQSSAPGVSGSPNTWHWDNFALDPAVPFFVTPGDRRRIGDADPNPTVTFGTPAAQGSHLRFSAVGTIELSIDGGPFVPAARQASSDEATGERDPSEHSSYWHPLPEGARTVTFRFGPDGGYSGPFQAKDFAMWSLTEAASAASPPAAPPSQSPPAPAPSPDPPEPAPQASPPSVEPPVAPLSLSGFHPIGLSLFLAVGEASTEELLREMSAQGANIDRCTVATYAERRWYVLVPAARVRAVNVEWSLRFAEGIADGTVLFSRCNQMASGNTLRYEFGPPSSYSPTLRPS